MAYFGLSTTDVDLCLGSSLYITGVPLVLQPEKKMRNLLESFGPVDRFERLSERGEAKEEGGDGGGVFAVKFKEPAHAHAAKEVLETFRLDYNDGGSEVTTGSSDDGASSRRPTIFFRCGWISDKKVQELASQLAEKERLDVEREKERVEEASCVLLENVFSPDEEVAKLEAMNAAGSTSGAVDSNNLWKQNLMGLLVQPLAGCPLRRMVIDDWTTKGRVLIFAGVPFAVLEDWAKQKASTSGGAGGAGAPPPSAEMVASHIRKMLHGQKFGTRTVRASVISVGQGENVVADNMSAYNTMTAAVPPQQPSR